MLLLPMPVIIRPLSDSDDLEQITLMIRQAYQPWLEMGYRYWGTFQTAEDTRMRFAQGAGYVAEVNGGIAGTLTFRQTYTGPELAPWYQREDVCFFSQFAVAVEHQKTGLGAQMMEFVESLAREQGFAEVALDTCEYATRLIAYYQRRGYRFIEHVQWQRPGVNYRSAVLSKNLHATETKT